MIKAINTYINSFRGLSKEVWILALVILINRSGLMVTTYLALYLEENLGYSVAKAGFIMFFYGIGSISGVSISGAIAEKVGYLKMQFFALISSGTVIFCMQFADVYWEFALLLFLAILFADLYRPANMASLTQFSTEENRTRSLALLRLAINLGISIGPFIGGILIESVGYRVLYFVDGLTCIAAGLVLFFMLGLKDKAIAQTKKSLKMPWHDVDIKSFKWLLFSNLFWTISFFQIIYTYALFMKTELKFSELVIGITFTLNGLLIFFMEMPIVKMYEKSSKRKMLYWGSILSAIAFIFLYFAEPSTSYLCYVFAFPVLYMIFITIGEVFYLPFVGAYALNMAPEGHASKFMSYYSLVFSIAHLVGPFFGPYIADRYGFETLWLIMGIAMIIVLFGVSKMREEKLK